MLSMSGRFYDCSSSERAKVFEVSDELVSTSPPDEIVNISGG